MKEIMLTTLELRCSRANRTVNTGGHTNVLL